MPLGPSSCHMDEGFYPWQCSNFWSSDFSEAALRVQLRHFHPPSLLPPPFLYPHSRLVSVMHMSFRFFVVISLAILGVNAQNSTTAQNSSGSSVSASGNVTATTTAPTSTFSSADGYTPCITNCSISAASAANCST
jgi:hypothetical protein